MIYLTGTNGQNWRSFADQLSAANPQSISLAVPSAKNLTSPGTEVICFAECPASLIAARAEDPSVTLERWKKSAGVLLALWRKSRQRVAILNWDECLADAAAFDQWLSDQIQTESGKAAGPLPTTQTSLASRVIAEVIVAQDREATRLWNELRVASLPIAKDFGGPRGASPALALRELAQQQEETLKTHEMLLQEIQNAHKESEDFFGQLEIARADAEATKQELERTAALLQETQGTRQGLQDQLNTAQGELNALKQESQTLKESALRNHEMLLQEIQNAHKESEIFFEQWKRLELDPSTKYFSADEVYLQAASSTPTHSHLEFLLEDCRVFDRHYRKLRVRLVEHHGKAGLAILYNERDQLPPLYHWSSDGKEDDLPYALFIPRDKQGRQKLQSAPATDLALINGAAGLALGYIALREHALVPRWLHIARILVHDLNNVGARVHYDSVQTALSSRRDAFNCLIHFKLRNALFEGAHATTLSLSWSPSPLGGTLTIIDNQSDLLVAPLSPLEPRHDFRSVVDLPCRSVSEWQCLGQKWLGFSQKSKSLILHLAQALPDFVFHLCEQHPDQKANKERLTKQARRLYHRLRNLDRRLKLRGAIAKLVRR
jgi:hypothetical protein